MYIEELEEGEVVVNKEEQFCEGAVVVSEAKRALVGAGARALFYPTLLYNVVRNKIQAEFRWWDRVDEFILLGAVPFPADVPRLKDLGVAGVVTLNESYETLVSSSLYLDHGINHLVIPTRDYLFAPSDSDIDRAIEFIHGNASCGKTTYVHCKAGRGRSTTIVLCYLVKHKHMTPEAAYDYVRSIRPRVLLASSQWQAVQEYYIRVRSADSEGEGDNSLKVLENYVRVRSADSEGECDNSSKVVEFPAQEELAAFDDGSVVVVSESDLDGYDECLDSGPTHDEVFACKVQVASQAAISRLSCLLLRYHSSQKMSTKKLGGVSIDINVY